MLMNGIRPKSISNELIEDISRKSIIQSNLKRMIWILPIGSGYAAFDGNQMEGTLCKHKSSAKGAAQDYARKGGFQYVVSEKVTEIPYGPTQENLDTDSGSADNSS